MVNVIMHGCNGKMGRVITNLVEEDDNIQIVAGIDAYTGMANEYPVFASIKECDVKADAIIDFSVTAAIDDLLDYAVSTKTPVVVCTTGLSANQLEKINEASKSVAVLRSANMSLGINTLMKILKIATDVLADRGFDIEIVEKHHNQKVDAPSGTALPSGEATSGKLSYKLRIDEIARSVALYCGFSQGMTYSFESPKVFDKLLLPKDSEFRKTVTISNPLGEDFSVMRTTSLNGMLTSLATNYNRRNKDVRLFEMGNIYLPKSLPVTDLPDERMQFTLGFYGDGDFFTMKGVVEEFLGQVGINKNITYDPKAGKTFLHPGRQANVICDDKVIGYLGEVHPLVCENYEMKTRAYVAVIDMPYIYEMANFDKKYEGIAKFPAVSRDISMVVPKEIMVGQIEDVIKQRGGNILEDYNLFDIYEGDQIEKGFKSVAYNIVFRAKDRTLEESDVSGAMKKILNGLEELGIQLRG